MTLVTYHSLPKYDINKLTGFISYFNQNDTFKKENLQQ